MKFAGSFTLVLVFSWKFNLNLCEQIAVLEKFQQGLY